jgi:hypothetical protein
MIRRPPHQDFLSENPMMIRRDFLVRFLSENRTASQQEQEALVQEVFPTPLPAVLEG